MKKFSAVVGMALLILFTLPVSSNNISVSNVSLENQNLTDHYCIVEFNIYWNNSWRTAAVPQNWDAAWVFVKYSVAGGDWQHATIDPSGSVAPAGSTLDFAGNTGVFIYRDSDGSGTFSLSDVGLRWNYGDDGVADDASVEVKVFAIEMVYVPQGSFYLGDGAATFTFYEYPTTTNPYLVDGTTITFNMSAGNLYATGSVGSSMLGVSLPSSFPTGYDAYYCMKYEVSQEQYKDFLNTLPRTAQNTRTRVDISGDTPFNGYINVLCNASTTTKRNGIVCPASGNGVSDPISFYCDYDGDGIYDESGDGQDIPCNYIRWMDLMAYADWAGLRPMTEGEFEKACRGPNVPVANEYAWGTSSIYTSSTYTMTNAGFPNEGISNLATGMGNSNNSSTFLTIDGPVRCGIFAAGSANHTRVETGAGYYGIMELSGNVREMCVSMLCVAGSSFTGLHGDGVLTSTGDANTDYWPGINGTANMNLPLGPYGGTTGVTSAAGGGERGAGYSTFYVYEQISDRNDANQLANLVNWMDANGGRLVRTAP